ncbi:sacsin [Canna indica]|uniref:Sacsin n=1 Tax=Canna indica TaxID=4628 RepID=A0AAQ3JRS4_9LILI|nr:sacsin [Canna indica]
MDPSTTPPDLRLLEDFGQRVDLTRRIREILINYPEGTTVLKELIQNADDAGATRICFCLDRRSHGTDSLLSPNLAQWQGPALLAYNDAVFTEDDFVSISRIGDSKKQSQTWKTGRFGVGFNSVYHLTDLPCFVSDKYVVLFDPQGAYLPNISAANPGKRLDYVSTSAISLYKDQFLPFCAFGCDMKKPFSGTIFRFPLRNADQAAVSRLSRQTYLEDDISFMFSQLYKESVFCLLFLKNIVTIEMYEWESGLNEPRKLHSCSLSSPNETIAWHRRALVRFSSSADSSNMQIDSFSLEILSESFSEIYSEKRSDSFFIVQAMAPPLSRIGNFATNAAKEYDVHLLPWASVAACISNDLPENSLLRQGQAFCSLPLPVVTGLSVQVNGFFEVSSNRRSLWYGSDMDKGGKLRSDWNRFLLEDVVAPVFNQLILGLRKLVGPTRMYYSLWPTGSYEEPWNILVEHIYKTICSYPVFYSEFRGGSWISLNSAFVHDEKFFKSEDLSEALVLLAMPVVHLPSALVHKLVEFYHNFHDRIVNPVTIRHFLKECETLTTLNRASKLILLEYCISDLDDADVAKHASGLALLPLATGEFGLFCEATKGTSYFVCNDLEYKLLSLVPDKVVDRSISPDLFGRLSKIANESKSNIRFLDGQSFLQLFPKLFPAGWKYKRSVSWNPELGTTFPTKDWFILFWKYLQDQPYNLSLLSDWPILPSTSGYLYRALEISKLLNAELLSDSMKELLSKIGCRIFDTKYGIEHRELPLYVYDGSAAGVLNSIFEACSSNNYQLQLLFQDFSIDEKIELSQFLLDPKWYYAVSMSDLDIENCKKLPIFRVYSEQQIATSQFSDLASSKKYLPPDGIPKYLLHADFIYCISEHDEDILMRFYGVERMKKTTFYKQDVLNRIHQLPSDVRDMVMLLILQDLPQLCLEDSSFKESLKKVEFVLTINGSLKSPQSLYDPRVEELFALLEETDYFPFGPYCEPNVLDMLLLLGLRTSVTADTIIQSAHRIESLMCRDQLKAHSRGKVLLSYLEVNAVKWLYNAPSDNFRKVNMMFSRVSAALKPRDVTSETNLEKFWNDLRMICWCPVLIKAPHPAIPWPSVTSMVAPPKVVRLQKDMWLVSASTRILDGECSSSVLSSYLGWSSPPSGSVIAAQLLELGKNNEIVTDQLLRQELAVAMPNIYSLLTSLIGSDEIDIVKAILEGSRWIWVGDGFATADEVVLNGHLHLAPYIRVIPVDLAVFSELFLELGVKEFLKPVDYAIILSRMAERKKCFPLDGQELRTAMLLVQHLVEVQFEDLQVQIYLPDVSCRLLPSTDLIFNDAPWVLGSSESSSRDTSTVTLDTKREVYNFVHGNISTDLAEKLGVRSLRRLLLAESSDSMNLSLSGVAEAFGQHEALTTRLKHIVEMYADGPGILFELVQNAEDAHASEVIFLLDKTQYGTSSILSPEMAEWQGPALYCFNNSVFSSKDLYSISRIGQDSKLEKPFAIGRFGLGFNCVYHFTDIPGFVSGENIVIFDPHACYLPGISPSHPGLRIRFVGRRILDQFPDQFSPFLHFGCNLQETFPGTLFRFPLRSEVAASRSQIKKEKYAPEDVERLFFSFSEVVSQALVFLRNVEKITIFVKDGSDQQMQLVYSVARHNVSGLVKEPHQHQSMLNFIHGNLKSGMDMDQFLKKLSKIEHKDLPWYCQKVAVLEQTPVGQVLHFWFTSESIGGGHARKKCLSLDSKSHKLIPWASVAAYMCSVDIKDVKELNEVLNQPLSRFLQNRNNFEGRAFCFLPLPVSTGLPVHVNAYFELSSNRRDIWFGNDMAGGGKARSEWNICLLEDVIAPTISRLLDVLAQEIGPCDLFFSHWPTAVGVEPWASMVRKVYACIADLGIPVLYTKARGGQWISTKQAIFPDYNFPKAVELTEALAIAGLPIICFSKPMVDRFLEVCPSLHFLNPHLLRTLLIRRKRGFKNKETVVMTLEYCLSDMIGSAFHEKLQGLPLVPLANGSFTMINKHGDGDRIFITSQNEFDLLKESLPHLLVDRTIPDEVFKKLYDMAQSGQSNMQVLTCFSLVELFPRILPTEWLHAKQVSWTPGQQGQPSLEWMGLLWIYLKESCPDLSVLSKWPILPVGNGCLLQLAENSNVIRDEGWSENMYSLLQKLGCLFLRANLPIDHPQLKKYVQDATASGILNAMQTIACQLKNFNDLFDYATVGEKHELRSFIFQSKWFSGNHLCANNIDTIKLLPIFECYKTRELTSLVNPVKWLKPDGIQEDLLDANFIRTESEKERSILKDYLCIREPTKFEFYKDHVLNRISEFLSQTSILSSILLDVKLLAEEDTSIEAALSDISFVLAADGSWQHPSRLYDPRIPGLQNMLHKEVFFPCNKFDKPEILDSLVGLGLKRSLSFMCLIDAARTVSILHESGNKDAVYYSRRLLVFLNFLGFQLSQTSIKGEHDECSSLILPKNYSSTFGDSQLEIPADGPCKFDQDVLDIFSNFDHDQPEDDFWSKLATITWCPVYVNPPVNGLPWFISENCVASPNVTRPKSQMWLVSSKMRILDGDCCSVYFQQKLDWNVKPNVRVLCSQLIELSSSYENLKMQSEKDLSIDSVLSREIPLIYSYLQEFVGTDRFEILKENLYGVPWVYIGDNFVSPRVLAFDSPVKYHPYLYVVPSELSQFRALLSELGVKLTFEAVDYVHVLQCLQRDVREEPLSAEQLSFVHRVLEAFADCYIEKRVPDALLNTLLIPDSSAILMPALSLVYNDAPWMKNNSLVGKHLVHPSITDDLAKTLGVQSLRSLSLVDEEMTRDLSCIDYATICELLALYGGNDFILFDLLELADKCKAKKLHLIYDKREHPRQSLLQQNLGDFQSASLTIVLEGATLSMEELCSLHLPPPWKIQGNTLHYGLGLISGYFLCDLMTIVSGGYLYIFDPLGLVLSAHSNGGPSARLFSLKDTDLTERFRDQFSPMLINKETSMSSSNSIVIRMPLSSKCRQEEESDCLRVKNIFDKFMHHASSALLFLKSVLQVSLSTWEEGSLRPSLNYSVSVDPSHAISRNPFSEKKWRKFQISRLFSGSGAATKVNVIDVQVINGGSIFVDKWLVVLCLGSGQTRNMALDRRYLAYDLTPIAGVAAHISQNGLPISAHTSSCILSPLPLSGTISMPVTALGCFLVCHDGGRYLFSRPLGKPLSEQQLEAKNHIIEAWNRELMLCVRDAYVELVLEFQRLRKEPLISTIDPSLARGVCSVLQAYGDRIYNFWPRSRQHFNSSNELDVSVNGLSTSKKTEADWLSLVDQVIRPFYTRLVDLPVWQLYGGNSVKADEGMFLSQSGGGDDSNSPPISVCSFIKEHYPVFSVPWELVREIQAVGVKTKEIKPKMVRDLLKSSSSVLLRSIETYMDVLEYCLADIQLQQSSDLFAINEEGNSMLGYHENATQSSSGSSGDALEIVSFFGKALYDFGRVVVEDIGRSGNNLARSATVGTGPYADQLLPPVISELRGTPFPTATNCLVRLGVTELWVGSEVQQFLMHPLANNFAHPQCLERHILTALLSDKNIQRFLKVRCFSAHLLSSNMRFLFNEKWVRHVMTNSQTPWVSWDNSTDSNCDGPTPKWILLFWRIFTDLKGELSLISDWPLIPAFLNGPVLCRVKELHLIFVPPITELDLLNRTSDSNGEGTDFLGSSVDVPQFELNKLYHSAFELTKSRYPWLFDLLNQFNVPVYDMSFLDCGIPDKIFPAHSQTLGHVVVSKLLAAKVAGYFSVPVDLSNEDRERLFSLFALDTKSSNGCPYKREELDLLRELPIFRTVLGTYTRLFSPDQCILSPSTFFHPMDERCLSNTMDANNLFRALGINELRDEDVLVKFALPEFERKTSGEQEDIVLYLYTNWKDLQLDSTVVNTLKETNFVRNANELCTELFKPRDLFDPHDSLLTSIFSGEHNKFPGERFITDGWLRILKKTGLRTSSQVDTIIECARKIERLGNEKYGSGDPNDFNADFSSNQDELSFEVWALAASLVETIFANFASLYDNNFCENLGKISFVPAEKGFPSISGKKGGKRVLTSYSEAVLLKDWPLSWTTAPILAKQNVIPPEYSWGAFRLRSPPAFSTVLKHLQVVGRDNGEDTLAHWPTSTGIMTVEDAFLEILKYMDKIWGTLSSSDILELQKVAFVPVANGTRLVTAKSLFVRLTINLSPFAFELPSSYLPFVKILKEIGTQEALTVSYARELLLNIQKSCGYQRLNPNELRAVIAVLNFMCSEAAHSTQNELDWLSDAIIPDDGCRLVSARSCVYVDYYGSQFISNIDMSRLRFAHTELSDSIFMALGIKKLSDIVIEELDEQELQVVGQIGPVNLSRMKDKLLSKSLQEVISIFMSNIAHHYPILEGLGLLQIKHLLEHIAEKLQFVERLHTKFLLLPKFVDITRQTKHSTISEWENSAKHRTLYFINKSKDHILIAEPPSFMTVYDVIATVISQVLGAPVTLPFGPLFACPDGSEKAVLKALKLGSEHGIAKHESKNSTLVGKELLSQDALQVQFLPLRPFYCGEIVSWKTGREGEKLRYGRVPEDVKPSAGQALYRFPVETAPGETQVLLSSQVFSFKSVSMSDVSSAPSSSEGNEGTKKNRMLHCQTSKDSGNEKTKIQTSKELQYGKVSAKELVQAVHDMLWAAGINMDAEKQALLQTTLTLQEQLKESQVSLLVEQEKVDTAVREADAAKAAWSCRVCLSSEVNVTIVPCGHVLCQRCSAAVSRCPFCRTQVSRTMKIFRP